MKEWNYFRKLVGGKAFLVAVGTVAGYMLCNSFILCLPLVYSRILEDAMNGHVAVGIWIVWFGVGILLLSLQRYFSYRNTVCKLSIQNNIIKKLYHWYQTHLDQRREEKGTGYFKNLLVKNTEQLVSLLDINTLGSLIHTVSFFLITVILFKIDWISGVMTCLLGGLAVMFHRIGNGNYMKHGEDAQKSKMDFFGDLQDTLNGSETVLSFGAEKQECSRNKVKLDCLNQKEKKLDIFRFLNFFVCLDSCKTAYLLLIVIRSFFLAFSGSITMAMAATLILYSQMTTNPIQYLNYALAQLQEGIVALKILVEELEQSTVQPLYPVRDIPFMKIRCEDISFSYTEKKVLEHFNMSFQAKHHYRLKASTGKGKTTLLRLLFRELEPQKGQILIDGQKKFERISAAVLLQSSVLFEGSLAENICFKAELDNKAKELVKIMELEPFSDSKFSTETLSGGEKSRVSLARALWHMEDTLILDEPLIGVDWEKKERILSKILPLLQDKLVLLVTHDEEIAQKFDCEEVLIF